MLQIFTRLRSNDVLNLRIHGGRGGCSASIFSGYVYKEMRSGKSKCIISLTGALLSTISPQQGESIPGIAHAVAVTTEGGN